MHLVLAILVLASLYACYGSGWAEKAGEWIIGAAIMISTVAAMAACVGAVILIGYLATHH